MASPEPPPDLLAHAEEFLNGNARLLERKLFTASFRGAPREPAVAVLRTYQNDDGGFGHALVPEWRGSESCPLVTLAALLVLESLDACDDPLLEGVFKHLIQQPAPGHRLHPMLGIVALLLRQGVVHPWVDDAAAACWRALDVYADPPAGSGGEPPCFEVLFPALGFVEQADCAGTSCEPQRLRARLESLVLEWDLVAFDPEQRGYGHGPLDWAPLPGSPGRQLFTDRQIERHLDVLVARQCDDGGWPADRPAATPAAALERRGVRTLQVLRTLRAYGQL